MQRKLGLISERDALASEQRSILTRCVGQERTDGPNAALVALEAFAERRQADAEGVVLPLVPPGTEAKDEPSGSGIVQHRRGFGHNCWLAERVGEDRDSDPLAGHAVDQRGRGRQGLERRTAAWLARV